MASIPKQPSARNVRPSLRFRAPNSGMRMKASAVPPSIDLRSEEPLADCPCGFGVSAAVATFWSVSIVKSDVAVPDMLGVMLACENEQTEITAYDVAGVDLRLGDTQNALRYFNLALEKRDMRMARLPGNSSLRKDPNYSMLMSRIDERLHLNASPLLHLAVTTEPGKLSVPPIARQ